MSPEDRIGHMFHHSCDTPRRGRRYLCPLCERLWTRDEDDRGGWWSEADSDWPKLVAVTVEFADGHSRTWHPNTVLR